MQCNVKPHSLFTLKLKGYFVSLGQIFQTCQIPSQFPAQPRPGQRRQCRAEYQILWSRADTSTNTSSGQTQGFKHQPVSSPVSCDSCALSWHLKMDPRTPDYAVTANCKYGG